VNLLPSAEQADLVSAARRLLEAALPVVGPDDADLVATASRALWPKLAELGWLSVAVPAEAGGMGGSSVDQALLFRELGRAVAAGPFVGTVFGAATAALARRPELAASLMSGGTVAGVGAAWRDPSSSVGETLSGRWRVVDTGPGSLALLVADNGVALADLSLADVVELDGADPTVPVVLATFSAAPAEAFVPSSEATLGLRARVAAAALLVGMIEACRDMSVAYALVREQFGRPIGSFQAVKHRCADLAVRAEAAGSLLWLAALSIDAGSPDASSLVASVKALASEYAVASAADNVQNHGGMGFTAECTAHRYVKRALEWSVTLGSPDALFLEVVR
jgi:alkylation response protein AidB-like acyl-CoA dehydrogenase